MSKPIKILDSGAYSAHTKGLKIDIKEYAKFCLENVEVFDYAINLDVIGDPDASYKNWLWLRKQGIDVLPVFHIGSDTIYLEKYLAKTDYICLGAIANLSSNKRRPGLDYIWKNYLVDPKTNLPTVKVHGLGLTAIELILQYPWYSVDSASPLLSSSFGAIFLPLFDSDGTPKYFDMFTVKVSDQAVHNKGVAGSYLNLPKLYQQRCEKLFAQYGYTLGEIAGVKQRPRLKKTLDKTHKFEDRLFEDEGKEINTRETLASWWEHRLSWNILMWQKLMLSLPPYPRPLDLDSLPSEQINVKGEHTKMFAVASTPNNLAIYAQCKPRPNVLASYAFMREKILTEIKKYT